MILDPASKARIYEENFHSIRKFAEYVCPEIMKNKTPEFHDEIYRNLRKNAFPKAYPDYKSLAMIVFRGGAKSTLGITINYLWRIAYDIETFVWLIAESIRQASERLHDVKHHLTTNERFIELYGDFTTDKFSETEIVTENPLTKHRGKWVALGTRQRQRGGMFEGHRVSLAHMDDFESEFNTETGDSRDKIKGWIHKVIMPAIDPVDGKVILAGTVVHNDSYLNDVYTKKAASEGYKVTSYEIEKNGSRDGSQPTWPDRFSTEWIRKEFRKYAAVGQESSFYQEYYNTAQAPTDQPFPRNLAKYWDGHYDSGIGAFITSDNSDIIPVDITIGVDPALGKTKGDFCGMVATGTDSHGKIRVDRTFNKRVQPSHLIELMFEWDEYYTFKSRSGDEIKPLFTIETVAMQGLLLEWIREQEKIRGTYLRKHKYQPRQGKVGENSRFLSMQPRYEAGIMMFKKHHHELLMQLWNWSPSTQLKNDDLIDAFHMSIIKSIPCRRLVPMFNGKELYPEMKKVKQHNWAVI